MKRTVAETIKALSLTSFTIERQTEGDSPEILSPIYEECIATHLRKSGYPDIYSWNIKLQKRPIKEIGYYIVKVSLTNESRDSTDVEVKIWVVPALYETKEKPKPSGFPKYYIQPSMLSTRKFYRVDELWSTTKKGYNAVWVDAQGKEHQCAVYSGDYKVLEEISKEKALSLIPLSSDFPKYFIPKFSSAVAYYRMDSKRYGISIWKSGRETKIDWELDSDFVREVTAQEVVGLITPKSPIAVPTTAKQGVSIKEAVRQLDAEGKVYVTQGIGRIPLFDNTNAVRVIMGAYKAASSRRGRVSLKEALRWAKNL